MQNKNCNNANANYDGYYNDVKPLDSRQIRAQTDPKLIKRIALVVAGTLALIILSVCVIYLL